MNPSKSLITNEARDAGGITDPRQLQTKKDIDEASHGPRGQLQTKKGIDEASPGPREAPVRLKNGVSPLLRPLARDFVPGQHDVICNSGRASKTHSGNVWFGRMVASLCGRMVAARGTAAGGILLNEILSHVKRRAVSGMGGFVMKNNDDARWYQMSDQAAREVIDQVRRSEAFSRNRSDTKIREHGYLLKIDPPHIRVHRPLVSGCLFSTIQPQRPRYKRNVHQRQTSSMSNPRTANDGSKPQHRLYYEREEK